MMNKPDIKYELEMAHGSIYGLEEEAAIIEVLNAPAEQEDKIIQFEKAYAAFCGTKYAVAVTSATSGLYLAGIAAGIKPGDEVITTPISWISTASSFSALGARIVFADVDPDTMNIDPTSLEKKITQRTKAIVVVHLYGQCCDMDPIMELASKYSIKVIEDCAHSPGGKYKGRMAGSLGHMGVFSFGRQKNLNTLGEGGMITTNDAKFHERCISYRSFCCKMYGKSEKYLSINEDQYPMEKNYWEYQYDDFGFNFRMTEVQAAVGLVQLHKLKKHTQIRQNLANQLSERLREIPGLVLPVISPQVKHVFHIYMIKLQDDFPMKKKDFMWRMYTQKGIRVWSHYTPIHLTAPYLKQGHCPNECPVAEREYGRLVTLPIHPRLTEQAIDYMVSSIKEIAKV